MIKHLNLKYTSEQFERLKELKEKARKKLNLTKLSWEKYFIFEKE